MGITVFGRCLSKALIFTFCSVQICITACSCSGRYMGFQRIFYSAPQGLGFEFSKLIIRKVGGTLPYFHCKSITKSKNFHSFVPFNLH